MGFEETVESDLMRMRREKLEKLRALGINPYLSHFKPSHSIAEVIEVAGSIDAEKLSGLQQEFILSGRLMTKREHGKTAFAHIKDGTDSIQIYCRKDHLGDQQFDLFLDLDIGDIVGVKGSLFRTRTGELTVLVKEVKLLTKALRPLPEKWHSLKDVETRYRQRYVDLIVNPEVNRLFKLRSAVIRSMRDFLNSYGFLEVETPMMQPIAGGAAARPFVTHHNALNRDFYLRIAPELYLKRLVVGGFERVYEMNRNFRNEGISSEHNPEFTMLEFYMAYADYQTLMEFTEEMLLSVVKSSHGSSKLEYSGKLIDFSPPWQRIKFKDAIGQFCGVDPACLEDKGEVARLASSLGINPGNYEIFGQAARAKILAKVFEQSVERSLIQPTFIIDYPIEICPLSKAKEDEPGVAERFELFIGGKEVANAYTELNDPVDQKERFDEQMRQRNLGDAEAHVMDLDYVRALEYGMPPTAGEGVGIDRLVMVLTDKQSIREVILFPLLREEK